MPIIDVDIEAVGRNTEAVARLLKTQDIDLVGVTKGCLGEPRIGAAMLAGGAIALADTRDSNLRRLRTALPGAELHRIYLPSVAGEFEPGDVTYVSSAVGASSVAGLGPDVEPVRSPRKIMLQVETGDMREGVPLELMEDLTRTLVADDRLELVGLSTNYGCLDGSSDGIRGSVDMIAQAAADLRAAGLPIRRVSGGNSSLLWLVARGEPMPLELTEVRCGEALLLGQDTLSYRPLPGCSNDACVMRAEVLEEYTKPARKGGQRRLVLAVGSQDLASASITFVDDELEELGRTADYVVVSASSRVRLKVGDMVDIIPSYEALVAAWTSPYVELRFH